MLIKQVTEEKCDKSDVEKWKYLITLNGTKPEMITKNGDKIC